MKREEVKFITKYQLYQNKMEILGSAIKGIQI